MENLQNNAEKLGSTQRLLSNAAYWRLYVPKLVTVLREGYSLTKFRADAIAGLTVAIVALPLAMALAIASGTTPDRGLYTAIVAGFLISALGGSRFQIGGPTGAFVVVVYNVIASHGYDGLVIATLIAGLILIAAGFAKLGTWIKYIPYPVVTGFTAGIAVIIFTSQVGDILGLKLATSPAGFVEKWIAYGGALGTIEPATFAVAMASLALILALRRWRPNAPVFLAAAVFGAVIVWLLKLPVTTIGDRFGELPTALPAPSLPEGVTFDRIRQLLPSAFTIAFLAGIESLLSAVVADGMTGRRHRSNCELVAQGVANCASAIMGGIPATGAIARTATNIRAGAYSPISGMMHAVFLLVFIVFLGRVASYVPLASLGAILVVVAWNMAELKSFRHLMAAPHEDRTVLLTTFVLTVLVDLTVAIEVGVVLAAIFFMHRMANVVEISTQKKLIEEDEDDFTRARITYGPAQLPDGVEVFQINGPFFFGAAARLGDELDQMRSPPKVFILRMGKVPFIDASGVAALEKFIAGAVARGTRVILCGVQPDVREVIEKLGLTTGPRAVAVAKNFEKALAMARDLTGATAPAKA